MISTCVEKTAALATRIRLYDGFHVSVDEIVSCWIKYYTILISHFSSECSFSVYLYRTVYSKKGIWGNGSWDSQPCMLSHANEILLVYSYFVSASIFKSYVQLWQLICCVCQTCGISKHYHKNMVIINRVHIFSLWLCR